MANGDFVVKTLSTERLVGGGMDINGVAKNAKTRVTCSITGTYVTGGFVLNARDLGLFAIDAIFVGANVFLNDTAPANGVPARGAYAAVSGSEGKLILNTSASTQAEATQGQDCSLTLVAFGDSADAPELT